MAHTPKFNQYRDDFRNHLSFKNSNKFIRWGPALIEIAEVFAIIAFDVPSPHQLHVTFTELFQYFITYCMPSNIISWSSQN
jgi:hypothetical protein